MVIITEGLLIQPVCNLAKENDPKIIPIPKKQLAKIQQAKKQLTKFK